MYERRKAALIQRVKLMHRSRWSPTPERKAAEAIATKLRELADLLDAAGVAQFGIEHAHDSQDDSQCEPDGLPLGWCSYKATRMHMRHLAETAERWAAALPDPRERVAAPFAALVLLHLRYQYDFPRPSLYADGPDVNELRLVLSSAGIHLSATRVRNLLANALKEFDPFLFPYQESNFL
jgi:hypothetical protein